MTQIATSLNVSALLDLVREAGQLALSHFKNITPQRKADNTFVTQADIDIEQLLVTRLQTLYPNHNVISEEGARVANNNEAPTWAIDPLDGTTAFVHGLPGWGIAIGLLEQGRPTFGMFYMPLLDDLTYTTGDAQVINQTHSLQHLIQPNWNNKRFLAITSSVHRQFKLDVPRMRTMGSVSANLIYLAKGVAAGAFIPNAHLWDLVAGTAIIQRSGGFLQYLSGKSIDYQDLLDGKRAPEPIIAAHPDLLPELQSSITSTRR
ncbi:MAG: inositol monophosphatase [Chloroflexota bacterium]